MESIHLKQNWVCRKTNSYSHSLEELHDSIDNNLLSST
jgi:hypothetical protein